MRPSALPISGPCPIDLDPYAEGGGTRFGCDHCRKDVHVLSNMTRSEAGDFLREHAGERLCLSYKVGKDGGIIFRDSTCSSTPKLEHRDLPIPATALDMTDIVPVGNLTRRRQERASAPASSMGVLALALAACTPHGGLERDMSGLGPSDLERNWHHNGTIPYAQTPPEEEMLVGDIAIPEYEVAAGGIQVPDEPPGGWANVRGELTVPDPADGGQVQEPCDPDPFPGASKNKRQAKKRARDQKVTGGAVIGPHDDL